MLGRSALRSTARSTLAAGRRQALNTASSPSFSSQAATSSRAASSSSSSRANRATFLFGTASAALALTLASNKQVIHNDAGDAPTLLTPPRRQSFADRSKANKGGIILIPRAVAEDPEALEEALAEAAEEESGDVASGDNDASLEAESAETIAAVIDEDVGANPDAEQQEQAGAYDPVTGAINWDCPCLGGMAHGPCGEQFKDAFSCFIYSEGEPKGIECVEKFKVMQDCFRAHPEVYKEELEMDEQVRQERVCTAAGERRC